MGEQINSQAAVKGAKCCHSGRRGLPCFGALSKLFLRLPPQLRLFEGTQMRSMTSDEAGKWCSQKAVGLTLTRDDVLRYKSSGEHRFFVTAPEEHRDIVFVVRDILSFRGEAAFTGGLLWLRRSSIGSPELVRVGWRILEDIRAHTGNRGLTVRHPRPGSFS